MDSGPIFSRSQIPVLSHDTAETLTQRLFQIGGWMLLEVLASLPAGNFYPVPQDPAEATFTNEITKEAGLIDWRLTASEIWRQVRAFQSWPEAYTYWQGKQLKIIEAFPLNSKLASEVGLVVKLSPADYPVRSPIGVVTGRGILGLLKVQIEGKRLMPVEEFIRGQRNFIGSVLTSARD